MQKTILILSLIGNVVLGYFILSPKDIDYDYTIYTNKIDSLESEVSTLKAKRDSIKERIDTVTIRIKTNTIKYEKAVNTIRNNSVTDDYLFFTEYLKWYRNYTDTVKGN